MSWELYRALERKEYSYADKLLDEAYDGKQKVQVLWWDKQGAGHIAWMGRKQATAFEENRRRMREQRFREECWKNYDWIVKGAPLLPDVQDAICQLRKTLEELG
jgi:hypothetical protein